MAPLAPTIEKKQGKGNEPHSSFQLPDKTNSPSRVHQWRFGPLEVLLIHHNHAYRPTLCARLLLKMGKKWNKGPAGHVFIAFCYSRQ